MSGFWTPEREAALRQHHAEGLSSAQSAQLLRNGCTRNMVIAKRHRLGLTRKAPPTAPRKIKAQTPSSAPSAPRRFIVAGKGMVFEAAAPRLPRVVIKERAETPGKVTLLGLGPCMCRWPIGNPASPAFSFCGARTEAGKTYCVEHARRAYVAAPPAKKTARKALAPRVREYAL